MPKPAMVMIDVETNGDCPPRDSMLSLGACVVEPGLGRKFYQEFAPLNDGYWTDEQLKTVPIHKLTPEMCKGFTDPVTATDNLRAWLESLGPVRFLADTGGFDWVFTHYYLRAFSDKPSPFGYSGRDVRALWMGYAAASKDKRRFGDLRPKGSHTHNALDDAVGNVVACLEMQKLGIKL